MEDGGKSLAEQSERHRGTTRRTREPQVVVGEIERKEKKGRTERLRLLLLGAQRGAGTGNKPPSLGCTCTSVCTGMGRHPGGDTLGVEHAQALGKQPRGAAVCVSVKNGGIFSNFV